jgi:hypothetical protein
MNRRNFIHAMLSLPALEPVLRAQSACLTSGLSSDWAAGLEVPGTVTKSFQPEAGQSRRPVWSAMSAADVTEYTKAFCKGYKKMLAMPREKPGSAVYQAWLHYHYCQQIDGASASAAFPSIHENSAFLPWHRAYLFYYERLIQVLSGVPGFRLAAFDWEKKQQIPKFFINDWATVPGCTPAGCRFEYVSDSVDLGQTHVTTWLHSNNSQDFQGKADSPSQAVGGPHGAVHQSLGSFMHNLPYAAFDPIFFAHHANIDRFWENWRQYYLKTKGPGFFANQTWPKEPARWIFYDAKIDDFVAVKPEQMLDLSQLGYDYDLPNVHPFDFDVLTGSPSNGLVRFEGADIERFRKRMEGAIGSRGSESPRFPAVARLSIHDAATDLFTLSLQADGKQLILGTLAVLGRHSMNMQPSFLTFPRLPQGRLWSMLAAGLEIGATPDGATIQSFELHYPKNRGDWKLLRTGA